MSRAAFAGRMDPVKTLMAVLLVSVLVALSGCYWISGPWTGPDKIEEKYEKIEVGMLREEVEDIFGDPSEIVYVTGEGTAPPEGSEEAENRPCLRPRPVPARRTGT